LRWGSSYSRRMFTCTIYVCLYFPPSSDGAASQQQHRIPNYIRYSTGIDKISNAVRYWLLGHHGAWVDPMLRFDIT
jgi:hypothetical protein